MEKIRKEHDKPCSGRGGSKGLFMKQHECKLCAHYLTCMHEICRFDLSTQNSKETTEKET
ncbi:MAG: hypothetical protein IJB44_06390 [Clostridia bacterium]|nr:hypothetical protein [Clostridia bacterium]